MSRRLVGPWTYGLKVRPAPGWGMGDQDKGAEFGITRAPSRKTMFEWLWLAMAGYMCFGEPNPPDDAWLPSNTQEVQWHGQRRRAFWYKAGLQHGKRYHDLTAAVADMPEKDIAKAREVLKTFLRLVHRAEVRGLRREKKTWKLSTKDAKKIRRKVQTSFLRWARS